jgi:CBS-domain-containing membrane protein
MSSEAEDAPAPAKRRRRSRLPVQLIAFLGVLAAGVLIGWVVFRDDDSPPTATAPVGSGPVVEPRVYPQMGLALGVPDGWRTRFRQGVVNVASRDDSVSVAFSVAGAASVGPRVRRSDRNELKRLFKAHEIGRRRAKVAGASTVLTELAGRTAKRQRIRILSMGPSSRWRTYSIQVFTVPRPSAPRLAELRVLLASVGFREPR